MSRARFPAIPTDLVRPNDMGGLNRTLGAMRERLEVMARERGRLEDSMVSVQDLLTLGLIQPTDLERLRRR